MSTNTASIHPVAVRNRIAKARRIVDFINANPTVFRRMTSSVAAAMNTEFWEMVNEAMGETRPPSALTIATVLGILAGQEVAS